MGWKYTFKGWNIDDGYFYYGGTNKWWMIPFEYFKIPKKAVVKYIEVR